MVIQVATLKQESLQWQEIRMLNGIYSCMFILYVDVDVEDQSEVIRLFSEKGVSLTDWIDTGRWCHRLRLPVRMTIGNG